MPISIQTKQFVTEAKEITVLAAIDGKLAGKKYQKKLHNRPFPIFVIYCFLIF